MILNKIKLKNPIEILQMGYAFLEYGDKKIVSTQEVKVGQVITTKLKDGSITSKIESIKEKK